MNLVVKDAIWQILGRLASAIAWFFVIKLITPYLGPLRYWDYSTILKYFAIWSAFADFWLYVIALRELGKIKNNHRQFDNKITDNKKYKSQTINKENTNIQKKNCKQSLILFTSPQAFSSDLYTLYNKFVWTRFFLIFVVYTTALTVAYLIPAYTSNPFIVYGLPIWMLFSATFMASGIVQLPLQLFWKMEQVSIALILARVVQISILIYVIFFLFPKVDFSTSNHIALIAFLLILGSVLASGFSQFLYILWQWNKYIPFKPIFDFSFIKNILKTNRKYGLAYYLSSFHTLIVLILLSIFFPTIKWFEYVGIWALALALIEILLIVPSALWNSLLHKIAWLNSEEKLKKFANLMMLVIMIWSFVWFNFLLFSDNIIYFISGTKYLTSYLWNIWSDYILPFLWIVLILSFVKQVFNYIFVSENLQNKLLTINLVGVILGIILGIIVIPHFHLIWWIITQLFLEIAFVSWAIIIAKKYNIYPSLNCIDFYKFLWILTTLGLIILLTKMLLNIQTNNILGFLFLAFLYNILVLFLTKNIIKKYLKSI